MVGRRGGAGRDLERREPEPGDVQGQMCARRNTQPSLDVADRGYRISPGRGRVSQSSVRPGKHRCIARFPRAFQRFPGRSRGRDRRSFRHEDAGQRHAGSRQFARRHLRRRNDPEYRRGFVVTPLPEQASSQPRVSRRGESWIVERFRRERRGPKRPFRFDQPALVSPRDADADAGQDDGAGVGRELAGAAEIPDRLGELRAFDCQPSELQRAGCGVARLTSLRQHVQCAVEQPPRPHRDDPLAPAPRRAREPDAGLPALCAVVAPRPK